MMHGPINIRFFRQSLTNIEISNFMEIRTVGTELFHDDGLTDGRTGGERERDMRKLIVAFRNFANSPEIQ